MRLESVDTKVAHFLIELDEKQTLCCVLSCGRRRNCIQWFYTDNIRFSCYCAVIVLVELAIALGLVSSSPILDIICQIIEILFFINVILDCNAFIVWEALKTFKVYYTTVNMCICVVAICIDTHVWSKWYNYNSNCLKNIDFALSVAKSVLFVFCVCIMDGYNITQYCKAFFCISALFHYIYFYFYKSYTLDETGTLFDQTFHWHTVAISAMTNGIAFMITQLYLNLKYQSKLVLIPTFVPFNCDINFDHNINNNFIHNRELEYDQDCQNTIDIKINKNYTLLRVLINCCTCNKCNKCAEGIFGGMYDILTSKLVLFSCLFLWSVSVFIYIFGYISKFFWVVALIVIIVTIIINLNLNGKVIKHILKQFTFWWKMQDVIVFAVAQGLILDNWIQICVILILDTFYVFMIAGIRALIIPSSQRVRNLISNGLIVVTIMYNISVAWNFWLVDTNEQLILWKKSDLTNTIKINLVTLMIEKKIDLVIFFMLQLYSNVVNGSHGIDVTASITIKWTTDINSMSENLLSPAAESTSLTNIELHSQLLFSDD